MAADNLALRSVYVDPDVDDSIRKRATTLGLSKADVFRRYLTAGIKAVRSRPDLFDRAVAPDEGAPLILRHVHIEPKLSDRLRVEAFDSNRSWNDQMRRYVRVGMDTSFPA
jgi:hypothetical protein